jgi:anti-sigma B factor antagonist
MSDGRHLFTVSDLDGAEGLELVGELDAVAVPVLLAAFATQNGRPNVTLDLSGLTFIDSTGVHAIVRFARSRAAAGTVTLAGASPFIARVFEIIGIADVPNIVIG